MTSQEAASPGGEPVVSAPSSEPPAFRRGWGGTLGLGILILGLALLAGVAAWLVGEHYFEYFKPSDEAATQAYDFRALNKEMLQVSALNGALAFGVLGGLLGLGLGVAGGLVRRSSRGILLGALVGLILGAAAGALPSLVLMPWHWKHRNDDPSATLLLTPLLIHAGLWSALGLAAGLAFGIGAGASRPFRLFEAALAGLIGALLGTFVFEMVGAFLLPMDRTAAPFAATSGARLLARLCVAGFVGLAAVGSLPTARPGTIGKGVHPGTEDGPIRARGARE